MKVLSSILIALLCMTADAAKTTPDGRILFGNDLECTLMRWAPGFRANCPAPAESGTWSFGAGQTVKLTRTIQKTAHETITASWKIENPSRIPSALIGWQIKLPIRSETRIETAEKTFTLPELHTEFFLADGKQCRKMTIVSGGRKLVLSGNFDYTLFDMRRYGNKNWVLRISPPNFESGAESSAQTLALSFSPPATHELDLRPIANRTFADEFPGDGKGGWTDQGPASDLRKLPAGKLNAGGITFDIRRDTPAVLALSTRPEQKLPQRAELKVSGLRAGSLALLHAAAWVGKDQPKLGEITVFYMDGTEQKFTVSPARHGGNWWNPTPRDRGMIAWQGEIPNARVGLYLTQFPLKNLPVSKLSWQTAGNSVWMIVGAALTDAVFNFSATREPVVCKPGKEWLPIPHPGTPVAGSELDFSWILDPPAGKYGRVIARPDGKFGFENAPERTIRFYGVNLCQDANFLEHAEADALVERLARHGYNSVRIHHQDGLLSAGKGKLNAKQLDRLDYLVAKLKARGIYVTSDLYANRRFQPGDGVKGVTSYKRSEMKQLIAFEPTAMTDWKSFVRAWMEHVNPYTGIRWGDEPAILGYSLLNECGLLYFYDMFPESAVRFEAEYKRWLGERKAQPELRAKFLREKQAFITAETSRFLRKELRVRTLLTAVNSGFSPLVTVGNFDADYVDSHNYWDHPRLPNGWGGPMSYLQRSAVANRAETPGTSMPMRIFGKPFLMSEINYCYPNRFRAEAGPLLGAYAALQDWGGLYRFAWSHERRSIISNTQPYTFDMAHDPLAHNADRIVKLLFLRGDVQSARGATAMTLPREIESHLKSNDLRALALPQSFRQQGLLRRIGCIETGKSFPAKMIPLSFQEDAPLSDPVRSETGEIILDSARNEMKVVTPRSEVLTFRSGKTTGACLAVSAPDDGNTRTVMASVLDGKTLAAGKRILLLHLTDAVPDGLTFDGPDRMTIRKGGRAALLLRRDKAEIELRLTPALPGIPRVTALTLDGADAGPVKSVYKDGVLRFAADPALYPCGVTAYRILR